MALFVVEYQLVYICTCLELVDRVESVRRVNDGLERWQVSWNGRLQWDDD